MSKPRDVARILGRTEAANPSNLALGLAGAGGVITQYDSVGLLPVTDLTSGDQAFVVSNSRIYVSNGSGWYNAAVANSAPSWDSGYTPSSTYEITDSATPLIVTTRASDTDDASVSYSLVNQDSSQYAFVTTQDSGVWTFTPRSADSANANAAAGLLRDSNEAAINVTFRATDGYNILSAPSIITYRWGGAAILAETGDTATEQTGNNGTVFYYGPGADTEDSDFFMNLNVTAGSTIGIGLIGGGGSGHFRAGVGGSGGFLVSRVVVPAGIDAMTIYSGGRGDYFFTGESGKANGGSYGGGDGGLGGTSVASYAKSASGGGYSGLFTGTTSTGGVFANAVVVVGGGGAAGSNGGSFNGGHGGGAGASGLSSGTGGGSPGTTSAGGAAGTRSASYVAGSGGVAGSQLQGGAGQGGQYDAGGGGGGGYYGGGGGRAGGGYDAGPGGGGSGYKIASGVTLDYNNGGNAGTVSNFQAAVRTASGASNFTMPSGSWGAGGTEAIDGKSGFALVWLPV